MSEEDDALETALEAARERGRIRVAAEAAEAVENPLVLSKVETNAQIGRLYYQCLNDAAGYPNGMAYWPEMPSNYKYMETLTAIDLIERLAKKGMITINVPMGVGDRPEWGKGECKELMDYFESNHQKELDEFNEKLAGMKAFLKSDKENNAG